MDVQREEGTPRSERYIVRRGWRLGTAARKLPEKSHLETRARTRVESIIKTKPKIISNSL